MASVTTTAGSKPAAPAKAAAAAADVSVPSRREFLYYIWGASMALLLGQATAGIIWFALPRFKEGTFGGIFNFPPEKVPFKPGGDPVFEPAGRFHVVHTEDEGVLVLYGVCTHLGCLPKWQDGRFRCPCHGSQYTLTGDWIQGPAPRGLDMFPTTLTFTDGTTAQSTDVVQPIPLAGHSTSEIVKIEIDTSKRVKRPNHA